MTWLETVNVTQGRDASSYGPSIPADGSTGAFYGAGGNGVYDVVVWD